MDRLPDGRVGEFEVRDWLNVFLGVLGVYLAVLANKIAKKQDQILDEQRAKKAQLSVTGTTQAESDTHVNIRLGIHNAGTGDTENCYWHLWIADEELFGLSVSPLNQTNGVPRQIGDGRNGRKWNGLYRDPMYSGKTVTLADVQIDKRKTAKELSVYWALNAREGEFPPGIRGEVKIKPGATEYLQPTVLAISTSHN